MAVSLPFSTPPRGRRTRDTLAQLGWLTLVALGLAAVSYSSVRLARHYQVLWFRPVVAARAIGDAVARETVTPAIDQSAEARAEDPSPLASLLRGGSGARSGTWVPIMLYHYIRTPPAHDRLGDNLSVTPSNFRLQLQYLKDHGWHPITMKDLDLALTGAQPLPPHPVVLTFDDGYEDFYTDAAPLLREFAFPATAYIATGLLGRKNYMTWEQVKELDQQGIEIAAHTQHHVNLGHAPLVLVKAEVYGCKQDLETNLGHPVTDFAYPYGGYNSVVASIVKAAGFLSATTTEQTGWHDAGHIFTMGRIRVGESDGYFASNLNAGLRYGRAGGSGPTPAQPSPQAEPDPRPRMD